jgi:hypothetical protein
MVAFRAIAWEDVISDLMYANAGGKIVPIFILPNGRSTFYQYQGDDPLTFFRVKLGSDGKPVLGPDGKPQYEVAGTISTQKFARRTLLMFFRAPNAPGQYKILAVDDSNAALPPGSCRFLNFSNFSLRISCGAAHGEVDPNGALTLSEAPPGKGDGAAAVEIWAITPQGPIRAYANRWQYGSTTRTLAFFALSPQDSSFELKRILEDLSALPTPPPSKR